SGTKALLFSDRGAILHRCDVAHAQHYPRPGWVEHDPEEIYRNTILAVRKLLAETGVDRAGIAALALTNQRETAVVWEKGSGRPVHNAVVWQCQRGAAICDSLAARLEGEGRADLIKERTGLVLSPYFSASKIRWILDNVPGAREKAERGGLLCGTVDSWLIWKLSGGKAHATDYSNASRTQLFDIGELRWDEELLDLFSIPRSMMAELRFSDRAFAQTDLEGLLEKPIPVSGVMGDSHAALFGQNCFVKGMAKATYGTGSSIMMNIGDRPIRSGSGLVCSIAWGMDGKVEYVFEGNINCTGATIQWLVDDLQLIGSAKEAGRIAATVPDTQGVYLVPAFVGLSAPYWDSAARASITGISRGTGKAHVVRAAEESIAYQIKDILDLMVRESGTDLPELRVDGGPTRDEFLMRFQADILSVPVVRSGIEELSATGSAYMAGLAVGFWKDKAEIASLRASDTEFRGTMEKAVIDKLYRGWKGAVGRALTEARALERGD
ncbi:MAG: glycerol kinase, partial [Treponema sp. GWA1_62_8]